MAVTRQKSSRKRQPSQSAESLLESLDHYKSSDVKKSRPKLYTDHTSSSKVLGMYIFGTILVRGHHGSDFM